MRAVRRAAAALAGLGLLGALGAPVAQARPSVGIDSLRVVRADGRPAPPPYRRTTRYAYRVEYRVGGDELLRVTRAATIFGPRGYLVATVRPPARSDDPGRYVVSAPIAIGPHARRGAYRLRYTIAVRDRAGAVTRGQRTLLLRFR